MDPFGRNELGKSIRLIASQLKFSAITQLQEARARLDEQNLVPLC